MAVRSSMAAIISRVRLLINDVLPIGSGQVFADQSIQDVLDATRLDMRNVALRPSPTFASSTISYLDYFSDYTDWEDDLVLKQFLITTVTPSASENVVGHWTFSTTTLPPVYVTGKTYDVYRSAADLLERWAAQYVLRFDFTSDGQSFRVSQAATALQNLAKTYRQKQRPRSLQMVRTDDVPGISPSNEPMSLGPKEIDYWG